jgi:acetyl esterase/lipase
LPVDEARLLKEIVTIPQPIKSESIVKTTLQLLLAITFATPVLAQVPSDADTRFKRFDKNNDGRISAEELGMPVVFPQADKNGDNFVTPDEFAGYLRQRQGDRRGKTARRRAPVPAKATEDLHVERDIRYRDAADSAPNLQSLDIYAPKDAENLPVMIYIHGGGWQRGDKAAVGLKPAYFSSRGWLFVSLNYRFVPAVDLLTQLQDSADAIAWVHSHVADHGGDAQQLHLMGHSAGAHHVAILATNERFLKAAGKELSILKSVVELDTQALDVPRMMHGSQTAVYSQAFGQDERLWREVSPLHHVAKGKEIPAFFLVVADNREQKVQQAAAFQKALQVAGVRCEFVEAPEHDHGSLNRAIGEPNDDVTRAMEKFHDSVLGLKSAPAAPNHNGAFSWQPSLTFDAAKTKEGPLPVNAMQLVMHRGQLFCGMATSFERDRYSRNSSYIYSKASADAPWKLEVDFGPGTSRVGQLFSARFVNDGNGRPIAGGPQEILVAFTMSLANRRGNLPLQMRVRDDATDRWLTVDLPTEEIAGSNVREVWLHRDSVTGADLLFVGANPSPLGIFVGSYDSTAPGRIRWNTTPEIAAQGRRGTSKWFGMASVNGALFASDVDSVFRRVDGLRPRWVRVLQFPRGVGDEGGAGVRGLTAVPNSQSLTGWSEEEMLLLATQMKIWRIRVPNAADETHDYAAELDLLPWLDEQLGGPVIFAESAFNRLTPFQAAPDTASMWPVGFQVVYPVPGKKLSNRDPASYRLKDDAWFLLRDAQAHYTLHRINSDARLFLARDFEPSPFASEPHILYACGYNGSYFKGSLGTAWIYRGALSESKEPAQ